MTVLVPDDVGVDVAVAHQRLDGSASLIVVLVPAAALMAAPSAWETITPGIVTLASGPPIVNGALALLLATMMPDAAGVLDVLGLRR